MSYGVTFMPSHRTARLFALNTLTFAILTASGSVCADDYFNLSVLETGTPLENTGALEAFLQHNGYPPDVI